MMGLGMLGLPSRTVPGIAGPTNIPVAAPQGLLARLKGGLGRFNQGLENQLFPMIGAEAQGLTPQQIQQARAAARMQLGLGLLSNVGSGKPFGQGLGNAFQMAQGNVEGAMQQAYQNARAKAADAREQSQIDRQMQRDQVLDERYQAEQERLMEQQRMAQERWQAEQEAQRQWRETQAKIDREQMQMQRELSGGQGLGKAPETRQTDRGLMQWSPETQEWKLVPGTEPTGIVGRPIPQGMADDLKNNAQVIGMIDQVMPKLKTPEGQGAVGARNAMIDFMTPDAISDNIKNWVDPKGTDTRALITNLNSFIVKQRNGAAVTVAEFARQRGFLPTDKDGPPAVEKKLSNLRKALETEQQYIVDFAESQGYRTPPSSVRPQEGLGQQSPAARKTLGGKTYVQVNGQWFEEG